MILHGPRLINQFFPLEISFLLSFKSILSNEFFMALTKVCLNAYFKMANTVRPKWNSILCSKWDTFKSARKVIKILSPPCTLGPKWNEIRVFWKVALCPCSSNGWKTYQSFSSFVLYDRRIYSNFDYMASILQPFEVQKSTAPSWKSPVSMVRILWHQSYLKEH